LRILANKRLASSSAKRTFANALFAYKKQRMRHAPFSSIRRRIILIFVLPRSLPNIKQKWVTNSEKWIITISLLVTYSEIRHDLRNFDFYLVNRAVAINYNKSLRFVAAILR
jgi:hypothetical protein